MTFVSPRLQAQENSFQLARNFSSTKIWLKFAWLIIGIVSLGLIFGLARSSSSKRPLSRDENW